MPNFKAVIRIIGINPYVTPPKAVLEAIFKAAKKSTSPIRVHGRIEKTAFKQNLVRYQGAWRLYLNTPMRRGSGKELGDSARFALAFDPKPRVTPMPQGLKQALSLEPNAQLAFAALAPSRRKEIQRYLNALKSEAARARNLGYVMEYLRGKEPLGMRPVLRLKA